MGLASERVAVTVAAAASFLTPFSGAATNVALPSLGRELGLDAVGLSWVGMAFLLAAAACLVPFGRLADIHGRRRVFLWGASVYALASVACGLAPTPSFLIAARVVQGIGGAAMFGTNVAILTSVLPPERRGAALGWNVAAVYLGLSLGPFLGGVLTEHAGWRSLFLLSGVLGATVAVVTAFGLRGEWAESRGEPFAAAGPLRLFASNRVFAFSNLAALVNYSATFAVGFLLSLYLQYARGLGAQAAGLVLVAQPALMTVLSPFAGRLSDRVPARIVASLGMGVTVLGLAPLAFLGRATPLSYIVLCLAVLGCGFGLFSSPNTNAVMGSVERRMYGVAAASLATMRLTGQMLSMAIALLLLSLFVGDAPLTPARSAPLVAAVRVAFGVFAVLCFGGVFASLARGSTHEHPPRPAA